MLLAGGSAPGCNIHPNSISAAALFGPESEGFAPTGNLNIGRDGHTATTLADESVLIVGGNKQKCLHGPESTKIG